MMQQYESSSTDTFSTTASTCVQPSEQSIKAILGFARSYQTIEVEGIQLEVYFN